MNLEIAEVDHADVPGVAVFDVRTLPLKGTALPDSTIRVENTETAEILTEKLSEVEVPTMQVASMASDSNDPTDFAEFQSRNEDRISIERLPMLTPADLVQLPKGQAFALIDGGQLWKIRIPLADTMDDGDVPADIEAMAVQMRKAVEAHEARDLTIEGKGSGW